MISTTPLEMVSEPSELGPLDQKTQTIKMGQLQTDTDSTDVMIPTLPTIPSPTATMFPQDTIGTLLEIRQTENKGYGVFALRDIMPGTILLNETPLVTLIDTGTRADPLDVAVNALSAAKRASYLSLHHFSRNPSESINRSIMYSNGYSIMRDLATGVFELASRINHSCVPNSLYEWKEDLGRMVFWNRFKLLEGEEVTVDYGHAKKYLAKIYGFECMCGGCTDAGSPLGSNEEKEKPASGMDELLRTVLLPETSLGENDGP